MKQGDYVVATKYEDGDPGDQYAVGYYDRCLDYRGQTRHMVTDGKGALFRGNGFRRCERITHNEGVYLIDHFPEFKPLELVKTDDAEDRMEGKSVWDWLEEARAAETVTGVQK